MPACGTCSDSTVRSPSMAHTGGGSVFGFSSSGGAAGGKPLFGGSAGGTAGTGDGDGGAGEGEGDGEGDNEVFGSGADAAPVVTLEEVPKVTGEEAEESCGGRREAAARDDRLRARVVFSCAFLLCSVISTKAHSLSRSLTCPPPTPRAPPARRVPF